MRTDQKIWEQPSSRFAFTVIMDSSQFKAPTTTPQDLLLIHDLIADQLTPVVPHTEIKKQIAVEDDDISSSSDEDERVEDSTEKDDAEEIEVVSDLLNVDDDAEDGKGSVPSSDSESSVDSESDSDIGDDPAQKGDHSKAPELDVEDDDENDGALAPGAVPQTKNEIVDADINIPDAEEIGEHEHMEKVGEVMAILDNKAVIVKGEASTNANRGSESALDSDTLLVFEDRKVLGYVYETFGPTSQPFYQVKFNQKYPLNQEKVKTGREVFHVPSRSKFVFVRDIKHLKGSDASNLFDEEPADHEVEYSDDEAEAAAKSRRKRKWGSDSRAGSVASSRHSTPGPSQMRDQDLRYMSGDAYAEKSPYDIDFTAAPSRPPPMPYDDDPYADAYIPPAAPSPSTSQQQISPPRNAGSDESRFRPVRPSNRGGDRRDGRPQRGRGRGRGRGDAPRRGRGDFGRSNPRPGPYNAPPDLSPSPSSPIAPWPTQPYYDPSVSPQFSYPPPPPSDPSVSWGLQPSYGPNAANFQPYVQPHINPRFASMFGINPNMAPQTQHMAFGQGTGQGTTMNVGDGRNQSTPNWSDEWTVHQGNPPSG
ncbi:hypothetical protein CCMSSC00406_0002816 [Pleurotus cornucopiae]|nr:hypothetical protein CCMSSC00406_0002816 [Pleurotus cornucopiae]